MCFVIIMHVWCICECMQVCDESSVLCVLVDRMYVYLCIDDFKDDSNDEGTHEP